MIGKIGKAEVKFREVIGAPHEVTMALDEEVRASYLNALFA